MVLSGILQGLGDLGSLYNDNAEMRHLEKVMSANPQFGAQLYNARAGLEQQQMVRRQEQEKMRQRDALRAIAPKFRSGMNMQDALSEYAALTGDVSPLMRLADTSDTANIRDFNYMQSNPAFAEYMKSKGERKLSGTEALVENVMAETGASYTQALAYVQKLAREGVVLPTGGGLSDIVAPSAPDAPPVAPAIESEPLPAGDFTDNGLEDPMITANKQAAAAQAARVGGYNPYARDDALPVVPVEQPAITAQPFPGYDELQTKRAADKAAAEAQAKADVELATAPEIAKETKAAELGAEREANKQKQLPFKAGVTQKATQMVNYYKELRDLGADIDINNSSLENILNRAAAGGFGQAASRFVGTKAQEVRDKINMMRPALISDIRQATEMGVKGLDSEKELEFYLSSVTDPTKSIGANLAALDVINKAYGLESSALSSPDQIEKLKKEFSKSLETTQQPANKGGIKFLGFE